MTDEEQQYAAAIPSWCSARTYEQHQAMMFCWGLMSDVERGEARPETHCTGCPMHLPIPESK